MREMASREKEEGKVTDLCYCCSSCLYATGERERRAEHEERKRMESWWRDPLTER